MKLVRCIQAAVLSALVLIPGVLPSFSAESTPPEPPTIDGTWRWTFAMPDGTRTPVKLLLETEDGILT